MSRNDPVRHNGGNSRLNRQLPPDSIPILGRSLHDRHSQTLVPKQKPGPRMFGAGKGVSGNRTVSVRYDKAARHDAANRRIVLTISKRSKQ